MKNVKNVSRSTQNSISFDIQVEATISPKLLEELEKSVAEFAESEKKVTNPKNIEIYAKIFRFGSLLQFLFLDSQIRYWFLQLLLRL
jgi:hypothetical protein